MATFFISSPSHCPKNTNSLIFLSMWHREPSKTLLKPPLWWPTSGASACIRGVPLLLTLGIDWQGCYRGRVRQKALPSPRPPLFPLECSVSLTATATLGRGFALWTGPQLSYPFSFPRLIDVDGPYFRFFIKFQLFPRLLLNQVSFLRCKFVWPLYFLTLSRFSLLFWNNWESGSGSCKNHFFVQGFSSICL